MSKSKKFVPDWYHEKAPERSYRSILKWGDPEAFKAPNAKLYELMKETFHMTDDDFKVKQEMAQNPRAQELSRVFAAEHDVPYDTERSRAALIAKLRAKHGLGAD